MKSFIISGFVAIAFLAAATTLLRSHSSIDRAVGSAGMMSVQQLHAGSAANALPIESFDDQSLVFSAETKR